MATGIKDTATSVLVNETKKHKKKKTIQDTNTISITLKRSNDADDLSISKKMYEETSSMEENNLTKKGVFEVKELVPKELTERTQLVTAYEKNTKNNNGTAVQYTEEDIISVKKKNKTKAPIIDSKNSTSNNTKLDNLQKSFRCPVCSKTFEFKSLLLRHEKKHTLEKPFQCMICAYSFTQKSSLDHHLTGHKGQKSYRCDECGLLSRNKWALGVHKKTHINTKQLTCNTCNKSFRHSCTLVNHQRTHTGEKPYVCDVCMKSFSKKYGLDVHYRIHTGEKPYECGNCENKFRTNSDLMRHIQRAHKT